MAISSNPRAVLAESLYPRAPQFLQDAPDMPEHQNFYIIQHGIRISGMPAWKGALNENEIWQVTMFLSHMDKLSPDDTMKWKSEVGDTTSRPPSPSDGAAKKGRTAMKTPH